MTKQVYLPRNVGVEYETCILRARNAGDGEPSQLSLLDDMYSLGRFVLNRISQTAHENGGRGYSDKRRMEVCSPELGPGPEHIATGLRHTQSITETAIAQACADEEERLSEDKPKAGPEPVVQILLNWRNNAKSGSKEGRLTSMFGTHYNFSSNQALPKNMDVLFSHLVDGSVLHGGGSALDGEGLSPDMSSVRLGLRQKPTVYRVVRAGFHSSMVRNGPGTVDKKNGRIEVRCLDATLVDEAAMSLIGTTASAIALDYLYSQDGKRGPEGIYTTDINSAGHDYNDANLFVDIEPDGGLKFGDSMLSAVAGERSRIDHAITVLPEVDQAFVEFGYDQALKRSYDYLDCLEKVVNGEQDIFTLMYRSDWATKVCIYLMTLQRMTEKANQTPAIRDMATALQTVDLKYGQVLISGSGIKRQGIIAQRDADTARIEGGGKVLISQSQVDDFGPESLNGRAGLRASLIRLAGDCALNSGRLKGDYGVLNLRSGQSGGSFSYNIVLGDVQSEKLSLELNSPSSIRFIRSQAQKFLGQDEADRRLKEICSPELWKEVISPDS